jgi:hypothetical protein
MPRLGLALRRRMAREAHLALLACCIRDPLIRLRFLRAAAPRNWSMPRLFRSPRYWIIWAGLVLALAASFLMKRASGKPEALDAVPAPPRTVPAAKPQETLPVWQVEQTADSEVYSNGLRIDTRFTVPNRPRLYPAFKEAGAASPGRVWRSRPAGIVYHTSESCQAPFEEQETPMLKRLGESLLEYVRRKHAYHYLIDRFGRVYRIVAETDSANHAGYSVWADDEWFYVNLNESFLGVSFEAQTHPGQTQSMVSPAQVRAAAMLTEMLRSRYQIPAGNCVTHAQVSVNPANMLVGYHTDWSSGFPFEAVGLPDNYQRALPSLWAFGFDCEPTWLASNRNGMSFGAKLAQLDIAHRAAAAGMRPATYRKTLRAQYRVWLAEMRRSSPRLAQLRSGGAGR